MPQIHSVKHYSSNTDYWIISFLSLNVPVDTLKSTLCRRLDREIHPDVISTAPLRWTEIFKLRMELSFLICQQRMKWSFTLALQWEMNWKTNIKITKQSLVPTWKVVHLVCFALLAFVYPLTHIQRRSKLPVPLPGALFAGFWVSSGKQAFFFPRRLLSLIGFGLFSLFL